MVFLKKNIMKKIICLLVTLLSITGFSQEVYKFKSGGRVFDSKNQKISPEEVRGLLANNDEALDLYEDGRNKKTFGNILLYGRFVSGIYLFSKDYFNHYIFFQKYHFQFILETKH